MIRPILDDWQAFWFKPQPAGQLLLARIGVCIACLLWLVSWWMELSFWFGESGVLSSEVAAQFAAYEGLSRWQLWSPLWWTDSLWLFQAWVGVGFVLTALVAAGIGGRFAVLALVLCVIGLAHRMSWLIGPVEPALVAFLGYLAVQPGPSIRESEAREQGCPWAGATLRLLQTHTWLLIAAGVIMQLASVRWWRGDAIWWLASAGRSNLLTLEHLVDRAYLVNALTHGMIVLQFVTLWLLLIRSTRWIGIGLGVVWCLALAFLADYAIYGTVLLGGLLAFVPMKEGESKPSLVA